MTGRMRGPTPAQAGVLAFIGDFILARGYPPSLADITAHFGWSSPNAAKEHVHRLVKKGLLAHDRGVARGLRILKETTQ